MNDSINQEILSELRKFRKISQFQTWLLAVFVIGGMACVALLRHERQRYSQAPPADQQSQSRPWDDVNAAMNRLCAPSVSPERISNQPNVY